MEQLYKFIESYLPDYYDIGWGDMDESKENQLAIIFYPGQAEKTSLDGTLEYESIKCHLELNCKKTSGSIEKAERDLRLFAKKIVDAYYCENGLEIIDVTMLRRAYQSGKNKYGIPKVVSDLDIKFILEDDING